jgi:hypothetical protein
LTGQMREIYYAPMRARCDDGRTRTVRVRHTHGSIYADTFFSVPAYARVKRKTVRGFVSSDEAGLRFTATTCHRNHALIAKEG